MKGLLSEAQSKAFLEILVLVMRAGLPLATLDQDLQKAANKTGVKRFAARD